MARWSAEMDVVLATAWEAGESARKISAVLGVSRLAVIGRARRLGCPPHKDGNQQRMARAKSERVRRPRSDKPRGPDRFKRPAWADQNRTVKIAMDVIPVRKTIFELGPNDCRYIYGDPTQGFWCNDESYYCGAQTDGSSYCAGHAAYVYNPGFANTSQRERPFRRRPENPAAVQERPLQGVGG